jgi:transposase
MQVLHPCCAGLDVHKDVVVASARLASKSEVRIDVANFDTTTPGLLALSDWLSERGCTHVAMEARASTGSLSGTFWPRPILS